MAPNLWPTEVAGLQGKRYGLYESLDKLGARILAALALHIGLPEDYFVGPTSFRQLDPAPDPLSADHRARRARTCAPARTRTST
jgi:hypothetical protein